MVNYTLKQLYSLEAVIRLKSFTKASKMLNITQPAVYMQIQQLQQNIGIPLISVKGKVISPTFIGQKVYDTSVNIIAQLETADAMIAQTLKPDTGHLQIAVATTANSFVSGILAKFKQKYPNISFHLQVTNRQSLLDKLSHHEIDLVIMGEPPKDIPLTTQAFMENPLIVISHPDNDLLLKKKVSIDDLRNQTLITREQDSGTRITIERVTGLKFNSDIEINSNETIIEAVQAGLGIGFVSEHTVKLQLEHGIIKRLKVEKFPIVRYWHIVHHSQKQLCPIANRFKQFIIEQYSKNTLK